MRTKFFMITASAALVLSVAPAVSVAALPSMPQPGEGWKFAPPVSDPTAAQSNCIASRNFGLRTPGAAITGGVFNYYGVPGFFPYGTGEPGSGTGGWVSGMALGDIGCG